MRVLAISDVYLPQICAASLSLNTLIHEMQAKGHAVTLIAPDYPGARDQPGDDVIRVSSHAIGTATVPRLMKISRVLEISDQLRSWNYGIVHIHTPYIAHIAGLVLAHRLGVPAVELWNVRHEEMLRRRVPRLRASWVRTVARWLTRLQCYGVDGFIVRSPEVRDRLKEYGVLKPTTVVPMGIEGHRFQPADGARFRAAHGLAPERPILLCTGAMKERRSVDFLLASLMEIRREIPNVALVVADSAAVLNTLREDVQNLGLRDNVAYAPDPNGSSSLDMYHAARCFVVPAGGDMESAPLLDAMAAGLPTVIAASGNVQEILGEDSPATTTEERVADFAAAVIALLRDTDRCAQLASAGRQYAQRWSASVTVEQVLDGYREALAPAQSSTRALAR